IVEYAEANHGLNVVGTGSPADNPAPDVAGSAGSGKTVQPAGVTVPDARGDVQNWTSARNLTIDGRRYDFIVDRSTQPLWPGDFNQGGYMGRWGPRVETDPFGRRRHALPSFLAPLLPGVCQRESVRCALNGARAGPVPAAGSGRLIRTLHSFHSFQRGGRRSM
ncbi:MAG TPA: hypothetical protein VNY79_05445, partial [Xanthobacteraceae bacterium]|nr:hypothetical protein [Xanthobacteraceae bacterium]